MSRSACAALAIALGVAVSGSRGSAFTAASPPAPRGLARQMASGTAQLPVPAAAGGVSTLAFAATLTTAAALAGLRRAERGPRTAMKARGGGAVEVGQTKLVIQAGKATPAPPIGPALGKLGVNIAFFVKEYNALTAAMDGVVPCILRVFADKSFTIELKAPPATALLFKVAGIPKGTDRPGSETAATITIDQLREATKLKMQDLHVPDITRGMMMMHGTAKSCGIDVEGYEEWRATKLPKPLTILDRYGLTMDRLPKEYLDEADLEEAPAAA